MKNVALTVSGNRYEIKLEDDFADFVNGWHTQPGDTFTKIDN